MSDEGDEGGEYDEDDEYDEGESDSDLAVMDEVPEGLGGRLDPPTILSTNPVRREAVPSSTASRLLIECERFVRPLVDAAAAGPEGIEAFLEESGLAAESVSEADWDRITTAVEAMAEVSDSIQQLLNADGEELLEYETISSQADELGTLYDDLREVTEVDAPDIEFEDLGRHLFEYLLVRYLERHQEGAYGTLALLGVITDSDDGAASIDVEQIGEIFTDPKGIASELYDWGDDEFDADQLLELLRYLGYELGVGPSRVSLPEEFAETLVDGGLPDGSVDSPAFDYLRLPLFTHQPEEDEESITTGLSVVPIPAGDDGGLPGLALVAFGAAELEDSGEIELEDDWAFEYGAGAAGSFDGVGIRLFPASEGLDVDVLDLDDGSVTASASLWAALRGEFEDDDEDGDELVLFGEDDGTRLSLTAVEASATAVAGDESSVAVELPATASLHVDAEEFGNFLGEVMPEEGIQATFDTTVGWSSADGLYFGAGGTMDATLPVDESLGPVTIEEVLVSLGVWAGDDAGEDDALTITATGAATAAIDIGGILHGRVENVGLETTLSLPDDGDGEYGPLDVDTGFKPPDGISVSVDLDGVGGEGYLYFEPEEGRYEGFVQLTVGDLVLTAFGILQTELDDGDGYSLLVLISGEFQPVQLGLGFTLSGVGGLLGLHREIDADALEGAVSSGGVGSVLFPEDPSENAPELISDLQTFFPIKRDNFVFGPMAQLGWGSPRVIEADLAVVMDVPVENIVLLGSVTTELPNVAESDDEDRPISLTMDFAGGYTISERRLWFRGALRDSKILVWDVEGGIALEQRSGDVSRFILSIGGFHDDYEPPDDFEVPDRIRFSMSAMGGSASVEFEAFFALTTNTVQAGAHIEAYLDLSIAEVTGELWFDTLIQFDPFEFVANLGASIEVDTSLGTASVGLSATLTGPNPYHLQGEADLPVGSKSIEVTFGDEEDLDALPPADVLSELAEDLESKANWSAQRVDSGSQLVTVSEVDEDDECVVVHPLGKLTVRQTVVPLETRIEIFGEARPEPHTKFDVTAARLVDADAEDDEDEEGAEDGEDGESEEGDDVGVDLDLTEPVDEEFAPAAFEQLSDAERLEAEPTEHKPAGRRMAAEAVSDGREDACQRAFVYDEVIEDDAERDRPLRVGHARATIESAVSEIGPLETEPVASAADYGKYTNPKATETLAAETIEAATGGVDSREDAAAAMTMMREAGDEGTSRRSSVGFRDREYVIVDAEDLVPVRFEGSPTEPTSRSSAKRALRRLERRDPAAADRLTIVAADRANRPDDAGESEMEVPA